MQRWDPERYARAAAFVPRLAGPMLELLRPKPGERLLDLGCGNGTLTAELVEAGHDVVGVDASAEQVAAARALGLDARVMDGHALDFADEFDAVLSNAALHWMREPDRVIDGVWRALKRGGRFAGDFGGAGNVRAVVDAIGAALARRGRRAADHDPWYFPSVEDYAARLSRRGFAIEHAALVPRPTPLPGPLEDWLDTFTGAFMAALPEGERRAARAEVVEAVRPALLGRDGVWVVDYVRLRFLARKPA
jgi:SAM-dependent methyltransferase